MNKQLIIGLVGYGSAGSGFYEILQKIKNPSAIIKTIVVRNKNKFRDISMPKHSFKYSDILFDPEIDTVVELIDDAAKAWEIVKQAIEARKNIITGNKKMIAENFSELLSLQEKHDVSVLYDASVCASIPIIRIIEEYYEKDLLESVSGILNGSTNYILSKMCTDKTTFNDALASAQKNGFAESNPYFDLSGWDSLYKLVVLAAHSFQIVISPNDITRFGIENLNKTDIDFISSRNLKIKLIASVVKSEATKIAAYVIPVFIESTHPLYNIEYEYNGIVVEGMGYEKQLMSGKGAGPLPTGSAVVSDLSALYRRYRYRLKSENKNTKLSLTDHRMLKIYVRSSIDIDISFINFENIISVTKTDVEQIIIANIWLYNLKQNQARIVAKNIFVAEIV